MTDLVFDARWIGAHGIGRFASEIAARLDAHDVLPLTTAPTAPLDPWRVAAYLRRRRPALYLTPGFNPPSRAVLAAGVPYVLTIHDLIHLDVAGEANWLKRQYYERLVRPAIAHAAAVLTVSEHARARIAAWAEVDVERITVVGNGVDRATFHPDVAPAPRERPYLFWIGNEKPHKNLDGLLRAFGAAALPEDLELVLAGAVSDRALAAWRPHAGSAAERVHHVGRISDAELAALYRGSVATIVPSLAEGFGLPAAEALACGAPVVAFATTSIPEVVGDAARLVPWSDDPRERTTRLARALEAIVADTAFRDAATACGPAQIAPFTWDAAAARVRAVIDAVG